MVGQSRFHSGSHTQRGMDSAEIVMKEIQRDLMTVILNLLAERIRQPGKPPHRHPHREVRPLVVGRTDVARITETLPALQPVLPNLSGFDTPG